MSFCGSGGSELVGVPVPNAATRIVPTSVADPHHFAVDPDPDPDPDPGCHFDADWIRILINTLIRIRMLVLLRLRQHYM
jgi:hypothetical protein